MVTPHDFAVTVRNIKVLKDEELLNVPGFIFKVDYEKELD